MHTCAKRILPTCRARLRIIDGVIGMLDALITRFTERQAAAPIFGNRQLSINTCDLLHIARGGQAATLVILRGATRPKRQKAYFRATLEGMRHARQCSGVVVAHVITATAHRLAIGIEAATGEAVAGTTTAASNGGAVALGIEETATKRETRGRLTHPSIVGK